ncbi:MAG TPA: hypothetical protein VGF45_14060 [Polyangia bacterium]
MSGNLEQIRPHGGLASKRLSAAEAGEESPLGEFVGSVTGTSLEEAVNGVEVTNEELVASTSVTQSPLVQQYGVRIVPFG